MRTRIQALWTLLMVGTATALVADPAAAAVAISRQGCVVLAVDAYDVDEAIVVSAPDSGASQEPAKIEPLSLACGENLVTATLNVELTTQLEMRFSAILICIDPAVPGGCTPEFQGLPVVPDRLVQAAPPVGFERQIVTATFVFPNVKPGNYSLRLRLFQGALLEYTIGARALTVHAIGQPGRGSARP